MKAMVIGANGQDGTFLVRHLLRRHYDVIGVGRQQQSRHDISSSLFSYYPVNLEKEGQLSTALSTHKPDVIFHVAAIHHSAGGQYEPLLSPMLKVNVVSVHDVLEYMRLRPHTRLCYASSAKVFGASPPPHVDEYTSIKNDCLYAISKNNAFHLIDYYRKKHNINASVLYLFNHESELRAGHFFIPKMLKILHQSLHNRCFLGHVNTLDFYCDWGSAEEYMDIMIDVLEKTPSEDYVLSRGECVSARQFVSELFSLYGLDYTRHVQELVKDTQALSSYHVDIGKLQRMIGRVPKVSIQSLCKKLIDNEMQLN